MKVDQNIMTRGTLVIDRYHTETEPRRYSIQRNNADGDPVARVTLSPAELFALVKGVNPCQSEIDREKAQLIRNADKLDLTDMIVLMAGIIANATYDRSFQDQIEGSIRSVYGDGVQVQRLTKVDIRDRLTLTELMMKTASGEDLRRLTAIRDACRDRLTV